MKGMLAVVLGMLVIASAVPVYCQGMAEEEQVGAEEAPAAMEIVSGQVASVDVVNMGLSVKKAADAVTGVAETVNIKLTPGAQILKSGATVSLADIKIGDKVTAECTKDAVGNITASKVTIQ